MKSKRCLILLGARDKNSILSTIPIELVRIILSFIPKKKNYLKELDRIRGDLIQDAYYDKINSKEMIEQEKVFKNMKMRFIKTLELSVKFNYFYHFGRRIIVTINLDEYKSKPIRLALKNLRYKKGYIDWDPLILTIDVGTTKSTFEKINGDIFKVLRKIYKMKSDVIPFSFCKDDYYLIYSKKEDIILSLMIDANDQVKNELRKVDFKDIKLEVDLYQIEGEYRTLDISFPKLLSIEPWRPKVSLRLPLMHICLDVPHKSKLTYILIKSIKKERDFNILKIGLTKTSFRCRC